MGDSSFLKSALFFLCVTLVVLLVMPKDCAKRGLPLAALRRHPAAPAQKGLHIETSTPERRQVTWPAGIDAARLQYLVEVDSRFAAPKTANCPKQAGPITPPIVDALQSLHYLEQQPGSAYAFTREGLLHVTSTDAGAWWAIPIAKRQFVHADAVECGSADQCTVTFTWQWQPNEIGQAMQPQTEPHQGTGHIVGGPGGWVVSEVGGVDAGL
jgi:hypothetical protein